MRRICFEHTPLARGGVLTIRVWYRLFRNKSHDKPLLLLYRDEPCVVIGRNQNPWKEVNLQLAALRRVPFLRRRSGGGTVYHVTNLIRKLSGLLYIRADTLPFVLLFQDLGNTNYSIHLPRTSFDRKETAKIVVHAVRSLGVDAYANERNDICAGGFKMSRHTLSHR